MTNSELKPESSVNELARLDEILSQLLDSIEATLFEDDESDALVSKLHVQIDARQILVSQVVNQAQFQDRAYIQELAESTKQFELRARKVLADREALIGAIRKGRRQTNLYKTIDSNR